MRRLSRMALAVGRVALACALVPAVASAQVLAQFFAPFAVSPLDDPGPAPNPALPFPGTLVCSTSSIPGSTPSGFSFNFTTGATQAALATACGSAVAPMLVHSFGVRFTGSLLAPAAGNYGLTFSSDDGNVLTINGTTVSTNWQNQGGGPGSIQVALNAGANPFVFDYFENSFGGAFAVLQLPPNVPVQPPPITGVPEPGSIVLLGSGLVVLAGVVRRRRA